MADKEKMFDALCKIMHDDMAPTMGCTGPISFIYSSAAAREVIGGNEILSIECIANGKFCARMGEVVTPALPEDTLEMACAAGAVAGITEMKYEVIRDITQQQIETAKSILPSVKVIPDWTAPELVYIDTTVTTELGTGRALIRGGMINVILLEKNGQTVFTSDYKESSADSGHEIAGYSLAELYDFTREVPIERLAFLKEAMEANDTIGQFGLEHNLGAGLGYHYGQLADDPISRVKALSCAACEARMVGIGMKVLSISGKGNLGIATVLPTYALARELDVSEDEAIRAVALACLISIRISVRIGGSTPIFCSCLVAACQAAAAGYVALHKGGADIIEKAIQNTMPATFGACCDGPRNACAMRMISAIGTGYDAAKLAMAGVQIPVNEGMIGVTSEDTVDILAYMSDHLDEMNTALMKKMVEKRPLTPPAEKKPLPKY